MAAGNGCGGRIVPGNVTAIDDDAGPNQRGSTGDGSAADLAAPDDATAISDAPATNDAPAVVDSGGGRDGGPVDTGRGAGGDAGFDLAPEVPVRVCAAPAKRCVGAVPQICDATGAWQSGAACPFSCTAGDCTGVCVPATTRCAAGNLQTCSAAGAWQTTGPVTARELLINPAFDLDTGSLNPGETGWTNPGVPIAYLANGTTGNGRPDVAAQSPPNLAWFGGLNNEDDRLTQTITIPAGATSLSFSFYYAIVTVENGAAETDTFDVQLLAGTQVISLAHLSDNDATDTWTLASVPVPTTLAGQTVTLQLHGVTNANRITSFYIDTLSLQAIACP